MPFIRRVCCFKPSTAALAIGYIGVFGGLFGSFLMLVSICLLDNRPVEIVPYILINPATAFSIFGLIFVIFLLGLLTSMVLIQGIDMKCHRKFLPWLYLNGFILVLLFPLYALSLLYCLYLATKFGLCGLMVVPFVVLLGETFYWYIYLIVFSVYDEIRDEVHETRI